jgi:hypothetical protein
VHRAPFPHQRRASRQDARQATSTFHRPNAAHCLGREGRRHVRHANRGLATELCDFHALEGQEPRKPTWYENGPKLASPNPNFQRLLDVEAMEARVKALEDEFAMLTATQGTGAHKCLRGHPTPSSHQGPMAPSPVDDAAHMQLRRGSRVDATDAMFSET